MHETSSSTVPAAATRRHQYTRILALDLGKFNSVLCDFDPATAEHRFQSLASTPAAVHELLVSLIGDADPHSIATSPFPSLGFVVARAPKR